MQVFSIILLIAQVLCCHLAIAGNAVPVIQRYAIVGTSDDGKRLAIMLTHFGPSSNAPFANLHVYEAGVTTPLLTDSAFRMSGGEDELADLAAGLLKKNGSSLTKLRINLNSPLYGDANFALVAPSASNFISGQVDIENVGVNDFQIQAQSCESCPTVPDAAIDLKFSSHHLILTPKNPEECLGGPIQLRTIMRTKAALWFILLRKTDALGIPFYLINVAGMGW
jgi:hypothetical protein